MDKPSISLKLNKGYLVVFLLIIAFISIYICCNTIPSTNYSIKSARKLNITAEANDMAGFTIITPEQLGGNFDEAIVYLNLTNVCIEINRTVHSLENAIQDGLITVEEIVAYARIDARNSICSETQTTTHGLTHFTYRYPEFDLCMTYDVYETPDGKQHLIEDITISALPSPATTSRSRSYNYLDEDSEYGYWLDREDWGLVFEISEVSSTQITLQYTQSGGQQIGDLVAESYDLLLVDATSEGKKSTSFIDTASGTFEKFEIPIISETSSEITINWAEAYGSLAPGDYFFKLYVSDIYDESEIHPLMVNYHDRQGYYVEFTIE